MANMQEYLDLTTDAYYAGGPEEYKDQLREEGAEEQWNADWPKIVIATIGGFVTGIAVPFVAKNVVPYAKEGMKTVRSFAHDKYIAIRSRRQADQSAEDAKDDADETYDPYKS